MCTTAAATCATSNVLSAILRPSGCRTPFSMRAVNAVAAFPIASKYVDFSLVSTVNHCSPISSCVQVMSKARPSSARHLERPVIACLDAVYGAELGRGVCADREPLLMTRPWYF
jgi:hypothetical protein